VVDDPHRTPGGNRYGSGCSYELPHVGSRRDPASTKNRRVATARRLVARRGRNGRRGVRHDAGIGAARRRAATRTARRRRAATHAGPDRHGRGGLRSTQHVAAGRVDAHIGGSVGHRDGVARGDLDDRVPKFGQFRQAGVCATVAPREHEGLRDVGSRHSAAGRRDRSGRRRGRGGHRRRRARAGSTRGGRRGRRDRERGAGRAQTGGCLLLGAVRVAAGDVCHEGNTSEQPHRDGQFGQVQLQLLREHYCSPFQACMLHIPLVRPKPGLCQRVLIWVPVTIDCMYSKLLDGVADGEYPLNVQTEVGTKVDRLPRGQLASFALGGCRHQAVGEDVDVAVNDLDPQLLVHLDSRLLADLRVGGTTVVGCESENAQDQREHRGDEEPAELVPCQRFGALGLGGRGEGPDGLLVPTSVRNLHEDEALQGVRQIFIHETNVVQSEAAGEAVKSFS
jgi:hypothetical protein